MNRNDVIDVLTAVAAGDRRTVGDADVDVWQAIIGELSKDFALQAVRDHMRDRPGVWLEPGHVYQRARQIHRDQLDRAPMAEIPARHRDDEHYPGDVKAERDTAPYPAGWDSEKRLAAYWYAVTMHAMPHSAAGWTAIDNQLAAAKAKRGAK